MTKGACDLLITAIRLSLTWRTVKSLKRTGTKSSDGLHDRNLGNIEVDWEILQLWALFSFHKIFTSSGAEWFLSFVPFYFYIKLIVLIALGIPGTNFPNFWFEIVLVPLMNHIHICLDLDWKEMIKREAVMIPFKFVDLFLIPGLISDEEAKIMKGIRDEQLREAMEVNNDALPKNLVVEETTNELSDLGIVDEEPPMEEEEEKKEVEPPLVTSPEKAIPSPEPKPKCEKETSPTRSSSFNSPVARSRVAVSSLQLRKFSRDHQLPAAITIRSNKKSRPKPENAVRLPKLNDRTKRVDSTNKSTPKRKNIRASARRKNKVGLDETDSASVVSTSSRRPPMVAFKHTKSSILSQTSKSPSRKSRKESQVPDMDDDLSTIAMDFDDDMSISSRRSVSSSVRKFITGDDNIRIRDFLFDLELPSIPSPKRASLGDDDASVSTRNSTISKKRRKGWVGVSEERRKALEEWKKEREAKRREGNLSKRHTSKTKIPTPKASRSKSKLSDAKGGSVRRSSRIASK
jgi:hypothetical protein